MAPDDPPASEEKSSRLDTSVLKLVARRLAHKRLLLTASLVFAATTFLWLFYVSEETLHPVSQLVSERKPVKSSRNGTRELQLPNPLDPVTSLNGPPTLRFRENLRNDTRYVTSWISAGWTNDVMTYGNLIYLGLISDRIPIVGKFTPSHVGGHVTPIPFGEVFDVPRLRQSLGKPILEWHEVKAEGSEIIEELGCWNLWEAVQEYEKFARGSRVPDDLRLDLSYTLAPSWVKLYPQFPGDFHVSFFSLLALSDPHFRNEYMTTPKPSPLNQASLSPDEHLLCFDYLYYAAASQAFEYDYDYSPAWKRVVQYMRWTPQLEHLADEYVRKTLGVPEGMATPPYVSIHIRHNDFQNWCGDTPVKDCYASIPVIARRVREVQRELMERKRIEARHVIMTSDERDPEWWAEVRAQGWLGVDHSNTSEIHGAWYPVLIDAVIQSNGEGFVGTERSTMSVLARRRVETWRNGSTRIVKWGWLGADDH